MSNRNTMIRFTLQRIQTEVRQQRLKAWSSASSTRLGDPQKLEFWAKLAKYQEDLRRIQVELSGKLGSLDFERSRLHNVPRDLRYSARQSIDDREAVTQDLVNLAASVLIELLSLYDDASAMKPNDWEKVFEDLVKYGEKLNKQVFHTVVQNVPAGPSITNPAPPTLGIGDMAPLIGLIAAIIARKFRR
jgi:hypothetical protein